MRPAIEIERLTYRYPDGTQALNGVDLNLGQGESLALVGPNGAGKSTLILQILGFLLPDAGEVRVLGRRVDSGSRAEVRSKVGMVFQNPDDQLFLGTVFDDVAFGPLNQGLGEEEARERVTAALRAVEAQALGNRFPGHLSVGQKRSVALATVLAMQPEILVLDEPASNLDPHSRRHLIEQLQSLSLGPASSSSAADLGPAETPAGAHTIVLATHDLEMVLDCCPRVVLISEGRIVADGSPLEILADADLMATHRLEVPYSLRRDHVHRFPLRGTLHERQHESDPHTSPH